MGENVDHQVDSDWYSIMVSWIQRRYRKYDCLRHSLNIIWFTLLLCGMILLSMKLCLWMAFKNDDVKLIADFIPVIEKMVWPVFWLIVVVLFLRHFSVTAAALPGLVRRSYLPYSPQPPIREVIKDKVDPSLDNVVNLGEEERNKSGVEGSNRLPVGRNFSEKIHREMVDRVLSVLAEEFGEKAYSEVRLAESSWRADGAFMHGERCYYVAVLPYMFKERVQGVIERVNGLLFAGKRNVADFSLMICLYDCETIDVSEFLPMRRRAKFSVIFRAWAKGSLPK